MPDVKLEKLTETTMFQLNNGSNNLDHYSKVKFICLVIKLSFIFVCYKIILKNSMKREKFELTDPKRLPRKQYLKDL